MADNHLSDEDKFLFRHMMAGVKPLGKNKRIDLPSHKTVIKSRTQDSRAEIASLNHRIYLSDHYQEEVQADTILSYCSQLISNKRPGELKNALIP